VKADIDGTEAPDLTQYDIIAVSTSGGKDSQVMLHEVHRQAVELGVEDKLVAIHADLGDMEWEGTEDLARLQAQMLGIKFHAVSRIGRHARRDSAKYKKGEEFGDILDYARRQKMWPSSTNRWCTSDFKRGPIIRAYTELVARHSEKITEEVAQLEEHMPAYRLGCDVGHPGGFEEYHRRLRLLAELKKPRPVSILECMGFRSQESPARAKRQVFERDERKSNTKRTVDTWLPIHDWTVEQVWARIRESGMPHHRAYDLGMPRLSCALCIFANRDALLLAGKHNPELLRKYVEVEDEIDHTFQANRSLREILEALEAGEEPGTIQSWEM